MFHFWVIIICSFLELSFWQKNWRWLLLPIDWRQPSKKGGCNADKLSANLHGHRIILPMKGLLLRRPETNMRCLLTSWDRCGVKIAIILEQTYWWTITGAASSLRSQTTILCRQSSWILWTPENLPHPGFTLVWRPFLFLFFRFLTYLEIWANMSSSS